VLARALDTSFPAAVRENITALTVARLWANACYRFAPPFLATIARGFDVGLAELGVALTISELLGLIAPIIGRFVDRMDRRAAMTAGLAGVAASTAIAAAAPSLLVFTLGVLLLGPSKIVFDVGLAAWVTDHVPYERRGRVIGITETSWALGLLVGVTSMGLITSLTSWRWGYATGAAAVAVMAVIIGRRMARDDVGRDERRAESNVRARIPASAWVMVATMFSLTASSQCVFVTFGPWLEEDFGFSSAGLAAIGFAIGAVELVSSSLSAGRTDTWGKERSVVFGCAFMVPSGLLLVIADASLVPGVLLLALFLMGFEFAIVSALPIVANIVPGAPGRGLGLGMGGATLGRAAMSVTATALFEWGGFGAPAVLAGLWALVAAAAISVYGRMTQPTPVDQLR
jgi:MFS transporter, DHA1 family, inner membrane transport protein